MVRSRRQYSALVSCSCEFLEGRQLLSGLAQDVQVLVKELQSIHASSKVTKAEVQAVTADFAAIAAVATKPSASSVDALEAEVKVVVEQGSITPVEAIALKKDAAAVLASANISQSLAEQTATDLNAMLVSSGFTKADAKAIEADVTAILTDLRTGKH